MKNCPTYNNLYPEWKMRILILSWIVMSIRGLTLKYVKPISCSQFKDYWVDGVAFPRLEPTHLDFKTKQTVV